jgi:D-alanyl-D-alanine dipeptidase
LLRFICIFLISLTLNASEQEKIKLVDVRELDSSIMVQMKYYTEDNFVGEVIEGYKANKCLLTKPAARALVKAQKLALNKGYSLLVHDCYRPQRGVNHFITWSENKKKIETKKKYYPNLNKEKLFELGYIAKKSGHSRGSTLDLTLYDKEKKAPVEMGTIYDFLDPLSNTKNPKVSPEHIKNRQILVAIMEKAGFKNYSKEWWHYTLNNEPNKKVYLDIDVQ